MTNITYSQCSDNDTEYVVDCANNSSTSDLKCAAIDQPIPLFIPASVDYVQAAVTILIILLSVTINGTYVYLVVRSKELHQRAFYLALVMVLVNLVYTLLLLPVVVVVAVAHKWLLGQVVCKASAILYGVYFLTNILVMAVLTLDRAFTVFMPFYYPRHGNKIAICMTVTLLCISITGPLISLGLGCIAFEAAFKICIPTGICNPVCRIVVPTYVFVVTFPCIVLALLLYVGICCKARQLKQATDVGDDTTTKLAFSMRITKTVVVLVLVIVGVMLTGSVLYGWATISGAYTLELYILQSIVGRTLINSVTIANPMIILRNRDVRDAWRKLNKRDVNSAS